MPNASCNTVQLFTYYLPHAVAGFSRLTRGYGLQVHVACALVRTLCQCSMTMPSAARMISHMVDEINDLLDPVRGKCVIHPFSVALRGRHAQRVVRAAHSLSALLHDRR